MKGAFREDRREREGTAVSLPEGRLQRCIVCWEERDRDGKCVSSATDGKNCRAPIVTTCLPRFLFSSFDKARLRGGFNKFCKDISKL